MEKVSLKSRTTLERIDDIENTLRGEIKKLSDKLTFHRQKKTAMLADRDLRIRLEERQLLNDMKAIQYYEIANSNLHLLRAVAYTEMRGMAREATPQWR